MTETSPSSVFYASAKPEQPKPLQKEDSKLVKGIKNAMNKWLERVGPKGVENRFIKAHENVLATLNSDQRKEVFAKEVDAWRKTGKIIGVAATVVDTALIGAGAGFAFIGWKNPLIGANLYTSFVAAIVPELSKFGDNPLSKSVTNLLIKPFEVTSYTVTDGKWNIAEAALTDRNVEEIGKYISIQPALASLGILLTGGPGHWLAHLAAKGSESFGKMKARTNNYVDSGKAAEHAIKVGNALGKAATETAKYVAEHPDEIRKTVETVNRVKRENAQTAQKLKEAQQKSAEIKLEAEYQDWIAHHPDKVYYEQSGQPMPSKADYVEIKAREAAARQAAREEEKRGEAK